MLLPEHVDRIFQEGELCRSSFTNERTLGTGPTTLPSMDAASAEAPERLTRGSPKTSRRNANGNCVVPLSSGRKRS